MDFKDPDTGQLLNREMLNQELTKIEKPAGIANPKDFRNEVVKFALRARAPTAAASNPSWTTYEKIRDVIERRMFSQVEDLLPVISFGSKKDRETREEARRVRRAHDVPRLHRTAGAAAGRVVHAGEAGRVKPAQPGSEDRQPHAILDRRLNPERQEPRATASASCAARKALVREAVRDASARAERQPTAPTQAARSPSPLHGVRSRSFRLRARAACATTCCPATRNTARATSIPRPPGGGGGGGPRGQPGRRRRGRLPLRAVARGVPRPLPGRPRAARSGEEAHGRGRRTPHWQRAGYRVTRARPRTSRSSRTMRNSLSRRIALTPPEAGGAAAAASGDRAARSRRRRPGSG